MFYVYQRCLECVSIYLMTARVHHHHFNWSLIGGNKNSISDMEPKYRQVYWSKSSFRTKIICLRYYGQLIKGAQLIEIDVKSDVKLDLIKEIHPLINRIINYNRDQDCRLRTWSPGPDVSKAETSSSVDEFIELVTTPMTRVVRTSE